LVNVMLLLSDRPAEAQAIEYFSQPAFAAAAGTPTIANFDGLSACNDCLAAINASVAGLGITITQAAAVGVNVVQNTASPFGANFVTAANINSGPNAISSSIYTNDADDSADSFDFVFTSPVSAAGLFAGNLGNVNNTFTTTVSFLDANGATLASEVLDQEHVGVISGAFVATTPWDRRVFYGITSTTPIKTIRVINAANDGDGITIDDVQFAAAPTTVQPALAFRVDDVTGNQVTLRWSPPAVGPAPTGYLVEGGVTPGTTWGAIPVGPVPYLSFAAPSGSFFVRVKSLDGGVVSAASNEVPLHVNVPVAPSAPGSLTGMANGSQLALSWKLTHGGGEPTDVILDVAGAVVTSLRLGPVESFTFPAVPPGSYTFSVRAANAAGTSASSATSSLTFPTGCTGAPATPANFLFFRVGRTVYLLWDPPASGGAPTAYQLNVTGAFTGTVPVGNTRSLSAPVPGGSYSVSVTALNPCGASAPTAVQTIVVP